MDKFGVPKKVNRNVIKAIYELNCRGLKNPNLSNICNSVELTMKNNVPVANLQSVVRQSLENLCNLGVIEKQGTNYYKTRIDDHLESCSPISSKKVNTQIFKNAVRKEKGSNLNPNNRKRVVLSEESIPENDPKSSIKRHRTSKMLSRKGRKVDLPKVRTPHMNKYLSSQIGEIEGECCSSSGNEFEDERTNTIYYTRSIELFYSMPPLLNAEIIESPRVEYEGFHKLYQNSDNLLQSVNERSHQTIGSQTQNYQLNKFYDAKIRIQKLDVSEENRSQLDEGVGSKISSESECQQTTNEQQKDPIVVDTESSHITNVAVIVTNHGNIKNDGSTDQTSEITNESVNQDQDPDKNQIMVEI